MTTRLLVASALACAISAGMATLGSADPWPAGWAALASQVTLIAGLISHAYRGRSKWASATVVALAAWVGLFSLPSAILLARPELLQRTTPTSVVAAIALVNLALFALAVGLSAVRPRSSAIDGPIAQAHPYEVRASALAGWFAAGIGGLALLFALRGGPIEYLSNLDKLGTVNAGLLPVVWLAQCTRYAATLAVLARWGKRKPLDYRLVLFLVTGVALAALIGARAFVAVAAVQLLLGYAVLRGVPRVRIVLPAAVAVAVVLVFVGGAVKRYSNYESAHPSTAVGLGEYLTSIAPGEALDAYATNYADGIRYIALAVEAVPRFADHEGLAAVEDLATRPIPRRIRPDVDRQPVISATFLPGEGASPAVPLIAIAFLGGGAAGVVVAFALIGVGIATLDRFLACRNVLSFPLLMATIALVVQVPILIRSGVPAGVVFLVLDVIAIYVIAATSVRTTGAPGYGRLAFRRRSAASDSFASTR